MRGPVKNVLIIADIEGSSGCRSKKASQFLNKDWANACVQMSLDINAAVQALFESGAENVTVQDFHRTAYNLLPELIEERAVVRHGYRAKPVYGIGGPGKAEAVLFIGLHAASGSNGFLPHTLTSRIAKLEVNGRLLPEAELFAASLAPFGIRPVFFSGCPVACAQANSALKGILTCPIEKENTSFDPVKWRTDLKDAVKNSLEVKTSPYNPAGPFHAIVTMRDGVKTAAKIAQRWKWKQEDDRVYIEAPTMQDLYYQLIRLAYLTPLIEKTMPLGLRIMNLQGWLGLQWVRRRLAPAKRQV